MFDDDTNLFVSHKDINTLFQIVNAELKNLETWFIQWTSLVQWKQTFIEPNKN